MFIRLYGMVFLSMVDLRGPRWWKKWRRSFAVTRFVKVSICSRAPTTFSIVYMLLGHSLKYMVLQCACILGANNTQIICIIVFGQSICLETLKFWLNVFLPKLGRLVCFFLEASDIWRGEDLRVQLMPKLSWTWHWVNYNCIYGPCHEHCVWQLSIFNLSRTLGCSPWELS